VRRELDFFSAMLTGFSSNSKVMKSYFMGLPTPVVNDERNKSQVEAINIYRTSSLDCRLNDPCEHCG